MNTQSPPPPSLPNRSEKESEALKIKSWEERGVEYWNARTQETLERVQSFIERDVGYNSLFHYKLGWFGEKGKQVKLPIMPDGLEYALTVAATSRHQYAEELKKAFIAYFRGSGEHWFPSASYGQCSEEEEIEVAENKWNDVLSLLERKENK